MTRAFLEDLEVAVDLVALRRMPSLWRQVRDATSLTVSVGREQVVVPLTRRPWHYGGQRLFLECPACSSRVGVLRLAPPGATCPLACRRCLARLGVRYRSQEGRL